MTQSKNTGGQENLDWNLTNQLSFCLNCILTGKGHSKSYKNVFVKFQI